MNILALNCHGLSYRAIVGRYAAISRTPVEQARLIVLHLGNGASVAAIAGGPEIRGSASRV